MQIRDQPLQPPDLWQNAEICGLAGGRRLSGANPWQDAYFGSRRIANPASSPVALPAAPA